MFFSKNNNYDCFVLQKINEEFFGDSVQEIEGGTENKLFLIDEKTILRVLFINNNSPVYNHVDRLILREISIVNELCNEKVNKLHYKPFSNGQYYQLFTVESGKIYFLQYDFIAGEHLRYNDISVEKIAQKIRRMPEVIQFMDLKNYYVESYDSLASCLHHRNFRYNQKILEHIEGYREYFDFFIENTRLLIDFKENNHNTFIHGDLHCGNILVGKEISFIDFGDVRKSVVEEELGIFLWGMSLKIHSTAKLKALISKFLNGYSVEEGLFNKEFCLRYAVQRYLDIHLFYLDANLKDDDKMRYQLNKFDNEKKMIDFFLTEICKYRQ